MPDKLELSEDVLRELEEVFKRYPVRRAALLPMLHIIQRELGHISAEAEEYVAQRLGLAPVKVHEVTTFYTMIHLQPVGRFHLQFCRTLSCALRGGEKLMAETARRLKIGEGEVSEDGRFSIEGVECLAACGNAPAMQVNDEYHWDLSPDKLVRLLEELSRR